MVSLSKEKSDMNITQGFSFGAKGDLHEGYYKFSKQKGPWANLVDEVELGQGVFGPMDTTPRKKSYGYKETMAHDLVSIERV